MPNSLNIAHTEVVQFFGSPKPVRACHTDPIRFVRHPSHTFIQRSGHAE